MFHRGKIQQLDRPERLYEAPVNAFVARFIGENNRFEGTLQAVTGTRCSIRIAGDACDRRLAGVAAACRRAGDGFAAARAGANRRARAYNPAAIAGCRLAGTLREVIYLGDHVRARVALPGNDDFTVKRPIDEAQPIAGDRRRGRARRGCPSTAGRSRGKTRAV